VIYSLMLLVTVKYVVFILMADAQGEGKKLFRLHSPKGGTFALLSLLLGKNKKEAPRGKYFAIFITLIAASLVIGDGVLTPSISVLSAIEGLKTYAPGMTSWVEIITIIIIFFLFVGQRFGTSKIGVTFSPVMTIWFFALSIIGIYQIALHPKILAAFNPGSAVLFLVHSKGAAFSRLGGVFLAVTGLEALYADLGR
jgi:KUP system potassium uptake protein